MYDVQNLSRIAEPGVRLIEYTIIQCDIKNKC